LCLAAWSARSFGPSDLKFDPEARTIHPTTVKERSFFKLNSNELAYALAHTPWAQLCNAALIDLSPTHPQFQLSARLLGSVDPFELLTIIEFLTTTTRTLPGNDSIYASANYNAVTTQYVNALDKIKRCLRILGRVIYSMSFLTSRGVIWTTLLQPVESNPIPHIHNHRHYTTNINNGFLRKYERAFTITFSFY
jgi:hypothetical protein